MFTGIIEETGIIKEFSINGNSAKIVVECKNILEDTNIGDSIAIDGVCQTVTNLSSNTFTAQVSNETLKVTTFSNFKSGKKVNLERALTLSSRLGGHIVTGHIDGFGKIKNIQKSGEFYNLTFEVERELSKYLAKKGSVTINGISLTIADIVSNEFKTAVIPHTFENTSLKYLKIPDFVNIEVDILAKYVEKFLSTNNNGVLDERFLKENGFF